MLMADTRRAKAMHSMQEKIPLVLLPGSLCDETMWEAQAKALSGIAHVQIIETANAETIEEMAEHVLRHARAKRFALAGFSLGGFIAFEAYRQAPERISHLALLDTTARPDHPDNRSRRLANIESFATKPSTVLDAFVDLTRGSKTPVHVANHVKQTMYKLGPSLYMAQQRAMLYRPDARPMLASIRCPTLVLCGAEDRATPPEVNQEIATNIPGAKYVELEGVGHMTPMEAPRLVNEALSNLLINSATNP